LHPETASAASLQSIRAGKESPTTNVGHVKSFFSRITKLLLGGAPVISEAPRFDNHRQPPVLAFVRRRTRRNDASHAPKSGQIS
jgi:hypothetical protein